MQTDRADAAWTVALAARTDVSAERLVATAALESSGPARAAVVEGASALVRVRELRAGGSQLPVVVVLDAAADSSAARQAAFAAGASDALLEADGARLAETVAFFAGLGEARRIRHRVRLPVSVSRARGGEEAAGAGTLESLSSSGAQLHLDRAPAMGDVLRVKIPVGATAVLETFGLVRGIAPREKATVARVRFVGMLAPERAVLERYLDGLERETRSTDPGDAMLEIRRLDAVTLRAGLARPDAAPEWLHAVLASLSHAEKKALEGSAGGNYGGPVAVVARVRAAALTDALERFDPVLDEEPRSAREVVMETLDAVASAEADVGGADAEASAALLEVSARLRRAVAARLPHLAVAYEDAYGKSEALRRLDRHEDRGLPASPGTKLRNRIVAGVAGLILGAAVVYGASSYFSRLQGDWQAPP